MTMEQRDRMIDAFTNDASVTVFLMSLKAGGVYSLCITCVARAGLVNVFSVDTWKVNAAGVALNLTAASHVFLMDPWCATIPISRSAAPACCAFGGHSAIFQATCCTPSVDMFPTAGGTQRSSSRRRTGSTAWVRILTLPPAERSYAWSREANLWRPKRKQAACQAGLDSAKAACLLLDTVGCVALQGSTSPSMRYASSSAAPSRSAS